jgi:predicted aldo/keto reductase-like oxidoreductase
MQLSRRDLILGAAGAAAFRIPAESMPLRPFGRTGWNSSLLALGTAEIPQTTEAVRAIGAALDGGVNYIDTAPTYQGTRSESAIGEALKSRRDKIFLATKTLERDAEGAYRELLASLERLQTDRVDLIQVHAVNDHATLDSVLAGTLKGLEKAKREGRARHIGISGHARPEVILRAIKTYPFDAILIPVSAMDVHVGDFAKLVLPEAKRLGIGIAGMKALKGIEIAKGEFDPSPFLRYAMSLPISTLTVGFRRESDVAANLKVARSFLKMDDLEMRRLEYGVKEVATVDNLWWKRT